MVLPKVWVQLAPGNLAEEENDGSAPAAEHVVERGLDVVPRPLVDQEVLGEHDYRPPARAHGLHDGVGHVPR